MGLVRFKKELTFDEFQSLEPKSDETLYFISDTQKIYLGSVEYGGRDLGVADSTSVTIDTTSGLSGNFILSMDEGNSLTTVNGLWAPPQGSQPIDNPHENNFVVVGGAGELADSQRALVTTLDNNPNSIPSAKAVYDSLNELALLWDGANEDALAAGGQTPWESQMSSLTFAANVTDTGSTTFMSNSVWAKIYLEVVYNVNPFLKDTIIASVPATTLGAKNNPRFPATFFFITPAGEESEESIEYMGTGALRVSDGNITLEQDINSSAGTKIMVVSHMYYLLYPQTIPAAPSA
ncbi:MAG: hypothetical protein LBT59_26355 [Clostridiales bacterium]|jgi:hypothetical protein|nr:hypothetical protein [Clostridiales bacterium]